MRQLQQDTVPAGRVSDHCDICKEERMSVLEGDKYVCEVCLTQGAQKSLTA